MDCGAEGSAPFAAPGLAVHARQRPRKTISVAVTVNPSASPSGTATPEKLHRMQEAFLACGGAQCGICTPGMIVASVSLLEQNSNPSEDDIRNGLSGNLCRCTGYMRIFEAVRQGAGR